MKGFTALLAGMLFGIGLAWSGMSDPAVVLSFLTISLDWNPALIGTMGGALAVTAVGYARVRRLERPLFEADFSIPTAGAVDKRLIAGASVFGVGWGLSGFCPGPGLVAFAVLDVRALTFVAAFLGGVFLYEALNRERVAVRDHTIADG